MHALMFPQGKIVKFKLYQPNTDQWLPHGNTNFTLLTLQETKHSSPCFSQETRVSWTLKSANVLPTT